MSFFYIPKSSYWTRVGKTEVVDSHSTPARYTLV